ncbi:MAG: hypothetical protein ABI369_12130 [Acetobacteraceae bacterium]
MTAQRDLVHFVGSVPLSDSEQVFRRLSEELGRFVKRIPDGETAERSRWIWFQREMLEAHPAMEVDPTAAPLRLTQWDGKLLRETRLLRLKAGVDRDTVEFDTGYDRAALHSYEVFRKLRAEGAIPAGVRFQVSLPTPMSPAWMYVSPAGRAAFLAAYERSLLGALGRIVAAVPEDDLAIQFDVCQEILVFENYFPGRPAEYKAVMFATLGRLGEAVPASVELGFHLCYGSPADEHLVQPRDAAILVEMMNGIETAVRRRIDFMHIPVPKDRDDDAYFAPLRDWKRGEGTRLYVGLIHHDDEAGDRRRIAAVKRVVPEFGIASECGWGRGDPARLPGLLRSHRHAAAGLRAE